MQARTGGDADEPRTDHQYFQEIEAAFVRLRGSPLLLSPADWQVASGWHRRGIPLALVVSTLEEFFARRAERGAGGKVQSLRYCASAVEAAWHEVRELRAAATREEPPELDVAERLAALASSLPPELPGRERLVRRIRGLGGAPPEVEAALAELGEAALTDAESRLTPEERAALEARADRSLAALAERLSPEELTVERDRLRRRLLRRQLGLPILSLFFPPAPG